MEEAEGAEHGNRRFIVVVDGNVAHRYSTGTLLQRLQYDIFTTGSAAGVLALMQVARPLLVLTEAELPDMAGAQLIRRIKEDTRPPAIPVVVYARSHAPELREACLRAGCAAFLHKPVEPAELYAVIQEASERHPRRYIRFDACLKLIVGDELFAECMSALSENGMYVNTPAPRGVDALLPLTLYLLNRKISLEGRVLYSFRDHTGPLKRPGMAIKFTRIAPADRAFIRQYIQHELTRGLPDLQSGG